MSSHIAHPDPTEREAFLVDGCPRCAEYVAELGLHFDVKRFRAFWKKMVAVEFDDIGGYASKADKALGRSLYYIALSFQRAYGLDPHSLDGETMLLVVPLEGP